MFDFIFQFSSPQEQIFSVYLFIELSSLLAAVKQTQNSDRFQMAASLIESDVDSMLISFWQAF